MAITFTKQDELRRITVSGSADYATKVTLHQNTRTIFVQGFDSTGIIPKSAKYALSGSTSTIVEGDDIGASQEFITIPAGAKHEISLNQGNRVLGGASLFIASSVLSGTLEVEADSTGVK